MCRWQLSFLTALAALLAMAGCSPTFNWREVRPEGTRLALLLPCKPDKAEKVVPLGGRPATLRLLGCDAGGATFAVAVADLGDLDDPTGQAKGAQEAKGAYLANVLAQWQNLTLANMKAGAPQTSPLKLTGLANPADGPAPVLVKAQGQRAGGEPVSGQAAYFTQGSQVFQVVVYAGKLAPEVAETFFGSLSFE